MLFNSNDEIFGKDEIINALRELGINKKDTICVHSEIFKMGRMLKNPKIVLQELCDVLCSFVDTILMPTFTFGFCDDFNNNITAIYDKNNSKTHVGVLSEYFRKIDGVYRTNDPIFSFGIYGKDTSKYSQDIYSCLGKNSIFEKMLENDVKIIFLGSSHIEGHTFFHHAEVMMNVSYRYSKIFNGILIDENLKQKECRVEFHVRSLERNSKLNEERVREVMLKENVMKIYKITNECEISTMSCREYFKTAVKYLQQDICYFVR